MGMPMGPINPVVAEFIGTMLLVLFGNGVVANVVLARTKGNSGGWIVISTGWALAVFIGVFVTQASSGAHLNPAVSIGFWAAGRFPARLLVPYLREAGLPDTADRSGRGYSRASSLTLHFAD